MDGWITYVPAWNGNRDDKDPITVDILPLTVRETKRMSRDLTAQRVKGGGVRTNQAEISERILLKHVRNITNLTEDGRPVTTGEDLLDSHYTVLAAEIEEAINDVSVLAEGDIKNFRSRSDGYLEKSHGTAKTAPNSSNAPETAAENGRTDLPSQTSRAGTS